MAGQWLSVVPTFKPPPESLDVICTLAKAGPVLVSDDGSPCTADTVLSQIAQLPNVRVIRNHSNLGIARALNQGLKAAHADGYRWLLTVDQDSQVDDRYAPSMVAYAQSRVSSGVALGAVGAGRVLDASGTLHYPLRTVVEGGEVLTVTEELVQSGTVWSVEALIHLGGFDESLGMDAIDAEACLKLRAHGFVVAVNPASTLEHEIQGAQQIRLLGRDVMVTGHSRERRTAMVRNRLRLFPREFSQSPIHALRTLRRTTVNILAAPLRHRSSPGQIQRRARSADR